jgi:hypothetical protein
MIDNNEYLGLVTNLRGCISEHTICTEDTIVERSLTLVRVPHAPAAEWGQWTS